MSDLISRKAILKHIEKTRQSVQMMDDTHRASIIMNGMYLCEKAVRNQPTAEPKTGKWIDTGSGQECDQCHEIQYGYDTGRNYCANCGAKMEVEDETD